MASMGQKYLVVSDNHGNMSNLEYVIERFRGKIEALIHCGDMEILPVSSVLAVQYFPD